MPTLTLACGHYDRVAALLDGTVGIEGCTIYPVPMESEDLFPRVVGRAEFDITEMSLSAPIAASRSRRTSRDGWSGSPSIR